MLLHLGLRGRAGYHSRVLQESLKRLKAAYHFSDRWHLKHVTPATVSRPINRKSD
ncbi:hypothetical protein Y047_5210 [Burkholderia pseudomallei MSHR3016]|nr:hypothetical protein Y047_5210 [Burkholderia pseudomallei MSHR3016]